MDQNNKKPEGCQFLPSSLLRLSLCFLKTQDLNLQIQLVQNFFETNFKLQQNLRLILQYVQQQAQFKRIVCEAQGEGKIKSSPILTDKDLSLRNHKIMKIYYDQDQLIEGNAQKHDQLACQALFYIEYRKQNSFIDFVIASTHQNNDLNFSNLCRTLSNLFNDGAYIGKLKIYDKEQNMVLNEATIYIENEVVHLFNIHDQFTFGILTDSNMLGYNQVKKLYRVLKEDFQKLIL